MASKLRQPTFETERLRLRPFRKSDAKALHALYGDVDNLRCWGVDPSPDLASTLVWHISFHPFHYALWAIEEKKSGKLVGMINYHRRDMRERRVDVGWMTLPKVQGKGYMTEAGRALLRHLFDRLKVHKVEALIRRTTSRRRRSPSAWDFAWRAARSATAGSRVDADIASCSTA